MLSFQDQYELCQTMAQDTDSTSLVFFKQQVNLGQNILETELGSFYTEETYTDLTEASVNSYPTPDQFVRLKIAYVTVGSRRYVMEEVHDEEMWQAFQASASDTVSDIAHKIIVRRDRFEIFPTPSSANNTITLIYEASGKDLSFADYTAGTITTLAASGTAVTGSSTAWTSAMIGRYFKIDSYPIWYKITAVGSATTLTLDKPYTGTAISAGTETYVIGEMPRTPASTHHIPVYYAMMNYYQGIKSNETRGSYFRSLYEADMSRAKTTFSKRYSSNYIEGNRARRMNLRGINPNNYPNAIT